MSKPLLNEAEKYLIEQWSEARRFEDGMNAVRERFRGMISTVVEAVQERHPAWTQTAQYFTQHWSNGEIVFAKSNWPVKQSKYPSGYSMFYLDLEHLTSAEKYDPYFGFYLQHCGGIDWAYTRKYLEKVVKKLGLVGIVESICASEDSTLFVMPAPTKADILNALLGDNMQTFVALFTEAYEVATRMDDAMDHVLAHAKLLTSN